MGPGSRDSRWLHWLHNVLGWDVVVLEKEQRPRTDGYMIDFFGTGFDAAEAMGMLPYLEELSYQVSEAALVDEHGECRVGLRYDRFARFLNGRLLSIMRPDLELALREAAVPRGAPALRRGA
ncbi:hypothetical protein ACQ4WX_03115 [Streptomyces lasalocidi]